MSKEDPLILGVTGLESEWETCTERKANTHHLGSTVFILFYYSRTEFSLLAQSSGLVKSDSSKLTKRSFFGVLLLLIFVFTLASTIDFPTFDFWLARSDFWLARSTFQQKIGNLVAVG